MPKNEHEITNVRYYSKVLIEPIGEITEIYSLRELTDIEWKIEELKLRQQHIMKRLGKIERKL